MQLRGYFFHTLSWVSSGQFFWNIIFRAAKQSGKESCVLAAELWGVLQIFTQWGVDGSIWNGWYLLFEDDKLKESCIIWDLKCTLESKWSIINTQVYTTLVNNNLQLLLLEERWPSINWLLHFIRVCLGLCCIQRELWLCYTRALLEVVSSYLTISSGRINLQSPGPSHKVTALYGSDTTVGIHWYLMYRGWEYIYTTVCLATCCFMSSSALVINSLAEETRASFTASRMLLVDSKEYNLSSTCPRGKCKRLNKTLRTYIEEVGWTLIPFLDMIHIQTIHNSTQPQ